ncbi:hypothetical protein DICSQDRAFT_139303 [Dichomitus squalens LYAD-421 SS1]|uniref:Uncharacterized protein n=1 Tax=Dichomitus squalens (strain LYAD-421) TaxID=732165 RepID=R7SQQ4_DICSQ|nr:uncharacterized protein DICSQDRAFT_139303 [Dichomitus squalens LYAD-421 SS1]EJF58524.1 hypothetical protein DICSQDRAFT_139303 [Dichomitus squalens LYAD-421 SS1]
MTAKQREEISSSSDQILFRGTRGVTFRSALESIRVGLYDTYTPFQKLNWWHHHARHDRRTWDAWAGAVVATDVKLNQRASGEVPDPLAISDLDICATHLADYSSLEQYTQMDNRLSIAFGMSIPFAMLARRTGLRMLYLPMNGLQRVLLAAILYQSFVVLHSRFENIKKIKDKGRYAAIVTAMFHNSSFDKAIEEHRRIVPPELDSLFRDD